MLRSHVLLLIKAIGKWSRGQIPGKFYEYIGSRNRIICIGPKDSEVAEIIQSEKLGYIVENDDGEMEKYIDKIYRQYMQTVQVKGLEEKQAAPFSSDIMVEKVTEILN